MTPDPLAVRQGEAARRPAWWTPKELAAYLRVSRATVTRLCEAGDITSKKVRGQWRIHVSAIEAYEADGVVKPRQKHKPDMSKFDEAEQYIN